MGPFRLEFVLSRRQRLSVELMPWLPALAATLGFAVGAAYLAVNASPWFLALLLLPALVYRGLFAFIFGLVFRGGLPVEVCVANGRLSVTAAGERRERSLAGIFQVFRSDDVWTVLHLDGSVLTIPVGAISDEQIRYLRALAHRTAARRAE